MLLDFFDEFSLPSLSTGAAVDLKGNANFAVITLPSAKPQMAENIPYAPMCHEEATINIKVAFPINTKTKL